MTSDHDDAVDLLSGQPKAVVAAKPEKAHRVHIPFDQSGKGFNVRARERSVCMRLL